MTQKDGTQAPQEAHLAMLDSMRREPNIDAQKNIARRSVESMTERDLNALKAVIEKGINLPRALEEEAFQQELIGMTKARLEALRKILPEKKAAVTPEEKEGGLMKKTIDGIDLVLDKVIPEEWDLTKNEKRAVGATTIATVGFVAAGLYMYFGAKRGKKEGQQIVNDANTATDNDANAAAEKKRIGWFGKTLIIGGLAAAGAIGLDHYLDGYIRKKILKGMEDAGERAKKELKKAGEALGFGEGEKYGLTNEQHEEAEKIYRYKGSTGKAEIAAIFGLKNGESSSEFERFMKDMQEKYQPEVDVESGVSYARVSVAVKNYEDQIGLALKEVGEWLRLHEFEIGITAVLAARMGILRGILDSTKTVAEKMWTIGNTIKGWGINHPFVALFLIGGSLASLKKLNDNALLPQNLHELSKASEKGVEIVRGVKDEAQKTIMAGLQNHLQTIGVIGQNVGAWMKTEMGNLATKIVETGPDMLKLTPEEIIAKKTSECVQSLRHTLEMKLGGVPIDDTQREAGIAGMCQEAMMKLDEFETEYIRTHCTTAPENDTSSALLESLKESLKPLHITLTKNGDIISWNDTDAPEEHDLCVDPAMKDAEEVKQHAERLRHGENSVEYLLGNAVDQLREAQRNGETFGDGPIAMVIGNFLYIVEDWRNAKNYVMVPLDLAADAMGFTPLSGNMNVSENWTEWAANFTKGTISCTLFSLNIALFAKMKRFIIGGGPLYTSRTTRLVMNIVPGLSHITMLRSMVESGNDVRVIRKFGLVEGRRINNALARAGVRPEWVAQLETGDKDALIKLANEANASTRDIKELKKTTNLTTIREQLKKLILRNLRVEEHRFKDILKNMKTLKFWNWPKAFDRKVIVYEDELYDILMVTYGEVDDLLKAGKTVEDLVKAGMSTEKLLKAGISADELMKLGIAADDLLQAGLSADDLSKAVEKLFKAGMSVEDLVKASASADNLFKAGASVDDLCKVGFSAEDLLKAGVSADDLLKAGVSAQDIADATAILAKNAASSADEAAELVKAKEFMEQIRNARSAKNDAELAELLKNPLLKKAAESGDEEAKALLRVTKWSKIGKYAGRAVGGLGIALDAYLLVDNQMQLNEAYAKKDAAAIQRLEARRISLGGGAAGGLIVTALGTAGLAFAPAVIIAGIQSEAIYSAIEEMEKSREDWAKSDSADLLAAIRNKVGEVTQADQATGDIGVVRLWKTTVWSDKDIEKDNDEKYANIEKSQIYQRYEMYGAYFVKNTLLAPEANEDAAQYKERIKACAQHQLNYIVKITQGKNDVVMMSQLENADTYGELMMMKAKLEEAGKPPVLEYLDANGAKATLDLAQLGMAIDAPKSVALVTRYNKEIKPLLLTQRITILQEAASQNQNISIDDVIRKSIMEVMRHEIYDAERAIRESNLSWGTETSTHNILRLALRAKIDGQLANIKKDAAADALTPEKMQEYLRQMRVMTQGARNNVQQLYEDASDAIKNKAYDEKDAAALTELMKDS